MLYISRLRLFQTIPLIFLLIILVSQISQAQETSSTSFFSKNQKYDGGVEAYNSNLDMKKHKKIGAGVAIGGSQGQMGLHAEINLDPELVLVLGTGMGPSYGTYTLQGKYNFEAMYITPYAKLGYSRWFSSGRVPSEATSSDVLRQLYSMDDLKNGRFDAHFAVGSVGAEYNQLEGELSGVNFFGEVTLMTELRSARVIPTGSVGLTYFY